MRFLTKGIDLVSAIYGVLISLILLVRRPLGERWGVIGVFNSFAHLLMLPALVLLPLSLTRRHRWLMLPLAVPALTFIRAYGAQFVRRRPAVISGRQVTVLTYNLHKEAKNLEPIIEVITAANADVVALQELSAEAADCFQSVLRDEYPYQALHPQSHASQGQGVLSRFPITAESYWRNPHIASESLGHLRVEIDVEGVLVTVYNTPPLHPGMGDKWFDTTIRAAEIDTVLERAVQDEGAVLIMGDFNMSDQSDDYLSLRARYGDTFGAVGRGMGFTFPDLRTFQSLPDYWPLPMPLPPFLRLDYIFHNDAFTPLEARVWPHSGGSDHRPVVATLTLKQKVQ